MANETPDSKLSQSFIEDEGNPNSNSSPTIALTKSQNLDPQFLSSNKPDSPDANLSNSDKDAPPLLNLDLDRNHISPPPPPSLLIEESEKDEPLYYRKLCRRLMNILNFNITAGEINEENGMKARTRSLQSMIHVGLTEARLEIIEKEIQKLRSDVDNLPEDFRTPHLKEPAYRHEVRRLDAMAFRFTAEKSAMPDETKSVIDLLVKSQGSISIVDQAEELTKEEKVATEGPAGGYTECVVERLRLRSRPLIKLLERITSSNILKDINVQEKSAVVFLRPFKLLVSWEKEIRSAFDELRAKVAKTKDKAEGGMPDAKTISRQEIQEILETRHSDEELLKDLELFVDVLDNDLRPVFMLREKIRNGTLEEIEYHDLWHLFELGDYVFDSSNMSNAHCVIAYTGGREPLVQRLPDYSDPSFHSVPGFVIDCYSLTYDGKGYGPKVKKITISKFIGRRHITELPVFPVKFAKDFSSLRINLVDRGSRYLSLTDVPYLHKTYVGSSLDEPPEEIESQVILDTTLAINKNPGWEENLGIDRDDIEQYGSRETYIESFKAGTMEGYEGSDLCHKDLEWDQQRAFNYLDRNKHLFSIRKANELLENEKMLLPLSVYGFVLRSRKWAALNSDKISDVVYESDFDDLVLPPGHKETVRAMVNTHSQGSKQNIPTEFGIGSTMDLVRGKGKGLIILLHGEPGVGKTSTAECVADLTKRPLFPITCGDIGETASEVQNNLDYNFQLAHKWGCVLLLDEADVFLSERTKDDLRRNAVVSVFLRTLEYYSGILFLTTNRVGTFDPAFKSRIHMSLYYPRLDIVATVNIYKLLLKRTTEQQRKTKVEFRIKPKEITKFARSHFKQLDNQGLGTWNGRQIRNAFQTAIALVEYDARQASPGSEMPILGEIQFHKVAEASLEFDKYLKATQKGTDSDLAYRKHIRTDKYGSQQPSKSIQTEVNPRMKYRTGNVFPERDEAPGLKLPNFDVDETDESEESDVDVDDSTQEKDVKGKGSTLVVPTKALATGGVGDAEDEEWEEFKRFQMMRRRNKG